MHIGSAVSQLVDPSESKLAFDLEELDKEDVEHHTNLLCSPIEIGSIDDLLVPFDEPPQSAIQRPPQPRPKTRKPSLKKPESPTKPTLVQEVDEDGGIDGLPTYAKPDSDPEDEDEDPTVIQRNKPTAPVYIRDLISGLKDSENYDRHRLALSSAADLIRRKTNFGMEVTDHLDQLAAELVGLKDTFELEDFQQMRLRGMIAAIVARPVQMGQWMSNQLFNGDYSMSQRASILTALSLAARELAGYREEDAVLTGAVVPNKDLFPSKRLPAALESRLAGEGFAVNEISAQLERTILKPMVLEAADKATGPDVLKVRTFSSRMDVEKKRKKAITNELAKIVADGFFFPLTGRYRAHLQAQ